jgi:hypothetical protein
MDAAPCANCPHPRGEHGVGDMADPDMDCRAPGCPCRDFTEGLILDQPRPDRESAPHPGGELNL